MNLFANSLGGLAIVVHYVLTFMMYVVIARALISWVSPDPSNPIVQFLSSATEPFLRPLRRYIPPLGGNIDLTPMVLLLAIIFLNYTLPKTLMHYSFVLSGEPAPVPLH